MYVLAAILIFLFHIVWVLLVVFGWMIPALWPVYMGALIVTLTSFILFRQCLLTTWEFDLLKRRDPTSEPSSGFLNFYGYKLIGQQISDRFIFRAALAFLSASIAINLYFKFFF